MCSWEVEQPYQGYNIKRDTERPAEADYNMSAENAKGKEDGGLGFQLGLGFLCT